MARTNVTDCITEAQRIMKPMQSGYILPVSTGYLAGNPEFFDRFVLENVANSRLLIES